MPMMKDFWQNDELANADPSHKIVQTPKTESAREIKKRETKMTPGDLMMVRTKSKRPEPMMCLSASHHPSLLSEQICSINDLSFCFVLYKTLLSLYTSI